MQENELEIHLPKAPDSGWGWIIVICTFLAGVFLDGIGYSYGILLIPIQEYFQTSKAAASLPISIYFGVMQLVGK